MKVMMGAGTLLMNTMVEILMQKKDQTAPIRIGAALIDGVEKMKTNSLVPWKTHGPNAGRTSYKTNLLVTKVMRRAGRILTDTLGEIQMDHTARIVTGYVLKNGLN
jgi:hypothetical protein